MLKFSLRVYMVNKCVTTQLLQL